MTIRNGMAKTASEVTLVATHYYNENYKRSRQIKTWMMHVLNGRSADSLYMQGI